MRGPRQSAKDPLRRLLDVSVVSEPVENDHGPNDFLDADSALFGDLPSFLQVHGIREKSNDLACES